MLNVKLIVLLALVLCVVQSCSIGEPEEPVAKCRCGCGLPDCPPCGPGRSCGCGCCPCRRGS